MPMAVLYAHLSVPPPRLTAVRPELPGAVNQVLARALSKEPEDRYDNCGDFADALRETLGLEPTIPHARPAPGRPRRNQPRSRQPRRPRSRAAGLAGR